MKNWNIRRLNAGFSGILNLDDHRGPGTHWVAFRFITLNSTAGTFEYFDSYGLPPPLEVLNFYKEIVHRLTTLRQNIDLKSTHEIFNWSPDELQDLHIVTCGWWCIYFLIERQRGTSWLSTIHPVLWHKGMGKDFLRKYFTILNIQTNSGHGQVEPRRW